MRSNQAGDGFERPAGPNGLRSDERLHQERIRRLAETAALMEAHDIRMCRRVNHR